MTAFQILVDCAKIVVSDFYHRKRKVKEYHRKREGKGREGGKKDDDGIMLQAKIYHSTV